MSIRASATRCSQTLCSMRRLPNATRLCSRRAIAPKRFLGGADGAHAMVDAARPEPPLRDLEPAPFAEQQVRGRHADVLQLDFHMAVRRVVIADRRSSARSTVMPGASIGTRIIDCWRCLASPRSVLPIKMATLQRGSPAPRRPPFAAVDDIILAVAGDVAFDVGGVGRGDRPARSSGRPSGSRRASAAPATPPSARACRSGAAPPYCRCRARSS